MRKLLCFKLILFTLLLVSCHSTDVALKQSRKSNNSTYVVEQDNHVSTPKVEEDNKEVVETASTPALFHTHEKIDVQAPKQYQDVSSSSAKTNSKAGQKKDVSQKHVLSSKHMPQAKKQHKSPMQGLFGHIGHSFGVVGLVFIIAGVVLVLIGGIIIDTLAALAIAFSFVFILIWLVLAILQGLFDVIL